MPERMTEKQAIRAGAKNYVEKPRPKLRPSIEAARREKDPDAPKFTAADILDKAEELCTTGEFELAVPFCDKALQMIPGSAKALEYKAIALQELGREEEAVAALLEAVESEPESGPSKYMYLGQLAGGQDAVDSFNVAIRIMVGDLDRLDADEGGAAEPAAAAAAAAAPVAGEGTARKELLNDLSSALCSIAEIYLTDLCDEVDADKTCIDALEQALTYNPECPQAMQLMASVYLSLEQADEALAWMEKSVGLWHTRPAEDDDDEAGAAAAAAVSAKATALDVSYDFRIGSAKILLELHQYDVAAEVLDQLLLEDAEVVEVWYLLGLTQGFAEGPEALSTLCRAKLLYIMLDADQEGILEHIDHLIDNSPEDEVETQSMLPCASTFGSLS